MDNILRIQKSIEYIEENLKEKLKLDSLAKKAFFSEFHYHRLFHSIVGEPVMEYIRKRRLTEAAKELVNSEKSISYIALDYQFSSSEAFSRAFKRMYGISPREFRMSKPQVISFRKAAVTEVSSKVHRNIGITLRNAA